MRNVEIVKPSDFLPPLAILEDSTQDRHQAVKKRHLAARRKERMQALRDSRRAIRKAHREMPLLPRNPADSFNRMSFTAMRGQGDAAVRDFWVVPEARNYGEGNEIGRRFADEFIAFSVSNPGYALLGAIVDDMDFADNSRIGIIVGFLWRIEQLAIRGALA